MGLLCLALAGCAETNRAGDPLMGMGPQPPAGQIPAVPGPPMPAAPAQQPALGMLPPAPGSPSSPAALASGPARPLDNGMRIGTDPMGGPASHYGQAQGPWTPGAVLQNPQDPAGVPPAPPTAVPPAPPAPIPPSAPIASPPLAPAAPGVSAAPPQPAPNGLTYEQAQTVLASRGVSWQRLEASDQGDWKFSCSVPSKQNQAVSRTYEAHATNYLDAIRAVLDKMNKD